MRWTKRAALSLIAAGWWLHCAPRAGAFTAAQATEIWDAYNRAFDAGTYYRKAQGRGEDHKNFWFNSEQLEMAADRAERSGSLRDKAALTSLVDGFDSIFGHDWTRVIYNDDVMWACLAHLRAYLVTGSIHADWARDAANNFNWVYNGRHFPHRAEPQYDDVYGGGMWWTSEHGAKGSKNACVNGPAALAAYYLSVAYPRDPSFLERAKKMYDWEKSHLYEPSGFLFDHYRGSRARRRPELQRGNIHRRGLFSA